MFASKARTRPEVAPWEQFCKDEARRAAHEFLEKVRRLQTTDRDSMEVPESVFATKFSAHFLDEVMDLTGSVPNGRVADYGRSGSGSGKKVGAGKTSWWNIFKRKQSHDDRGGVLIGSSAVNRNAGGGLRSQHMLQHQCCVVLEAQAKMLDMTSSSAELTWQACRLALTSEQGNHQLEIYSPPKVSEERERERRDIKEKARETRRERGVNRGSVYVGSGCLLDTHTRPAPF